jgi:hypothetical protein
MVVPNQTGGDTVKIDTVSCGPDVTTAPVRATVPNGGGFEDPTDRTKAPDIQQEVEPPPKV